MTDKDKAQDKAQVKTSITKNSDQVKNLKDKAHKDNHAEKEVGGRGGLDPARYDDWEIKGKCVDF